ncbi:MAG: hypothetical protein HQ492_12670 [Woeseiaceae bacterium]|nr:hypothetical protein [Woeseiaceae bacterium]
MKRNQKIKYLINKKFEQLKKWNGWFFWPMPFALAMTAIAFQLGSLPGAFILAISIGLYFACRPVKAVC